MLKRSPAAVLLALAACVTGTDEPTDEIPFRGPAAEAEAPVLDAVIEDPASEPAAWRNQRPLPGADSIATVEDETVKVAISDLLVNDADPEGGRVVFAGLGTTRGGSASVVGGMVVFAPSADFAGQAWFDYVVSDGRLQAAGRVRVAVAPINDAPVAYGDRFDVMAGDELAFQLNAFDPDGDALAVEIAEYPAHGVLTSDADKYVYIPDPSFSGTDRLVYRVADAEAWSELVDVELIVAARP